MSTEEPQTTSTVDSSQLNQQQTSNNEESKTQTPIQTNQIGHLELYEISYA